MRPRSGNEFPDPIRVGGASGADPDRRSSGMFARTPVASCAAWPARVNSGTTLMSAKLLSSALRPIYEHVLAGGRVTDDQALQLYASHDLNGLGAIANLLRERKNGNVATYLHNQYINYSNHCILACQFCAFGARARDTHAFEMSIEQIVEKARAGLKLGITEIHMVGGLHPTLKGEWYLELIRALRGLDPNFFVKA